MQINEIYQKYQIPRMLREHQIRVASVARLIAQNMTIPNMNIEEITTVALLHDMGNIIKFNMDFMPESFEPEGVEFYRKVKADYISKYGNDEHTATQIIAKEIGVSQSVINLLLEGGLGKSPETLLDNSFARKICLYADQRVNPTGVVSMEERILSGRARYIKNKMEHSISSSEERFKILFVAIKNIEQQIFEKCKINPSDVTEESIAQIYNELSVYDVVVN